MLKHGAARKGARSPEWQAWWTMKVRCTNPNVINYERYGGRGITVHPSWLNDFPKFLKDVGFRPSPEHTLDRIDNEKGYEPGNVKWSTREEQNRNKRSNIWVEINGRRMILKDWARELGVNYKRAHERIQSGWDATEALLKPKGAKR